MKNIEDFKRDFLAIRKFANEGGFTDEKARRASEQLMELVETQYRHLVPEIIEFLDEKMKRGALMSILEDLIGGAPDCGDPECPGCTARREEKKSKQEVKKRDGEDNVYEFPNNGNIH